VSPGIIPEDVAGWVIQAIKETLAAQPSHLSCRITDEGTAIGIYDIQQRWQTKEPYLFPVCQLRLTGNKWHLYWMRKFDAWWPYEPPKKGRKYSLDAHLQQLIADEYGCFWV